MFGVFLYFPATFRVRVRLYYKGSIYSSNVGWEKGGVRDRMAEGGSGYLKIRWHMYGCI